MAETLTNRPEAWCRPSSGRGAQPPFSPNFQLPRLREKADMPKEVELNVNNASHDLSRLFTCP